MGAVVTVLGAASLSVWVALWMLPWQPHRTRERFEGGARRADPNLSDICVVIPARNEAAELPATLAALARQGAGLAAVVVDDESSDGTAEVATATARTLAAAAPGGREQLEVIVVPGGPRPSGGGGTLGALQQGLERVDREYTLLLDADIELAPGFLPELREDMRTREVTLYSVMALLRARSFWERLLVPPFIYFFKLLYPFALANDPRSRVAAAAGGLILVRTDALRALGGFAAIRDALIDDCSLAAAVKRAGHATRLVLSHSVVSRRAYESLDTFWRMVSRTAFTQLRYSSALLLGATAIMLALFAAPVAAVLAAPISVAGLLGGLAWLAMALAFAPVVRFYRLPLAWALTLPFSSALFLAMTWDSALAYWRGTRARWKGRAYEVPKV
jgi:hopene-associated glycosyltransferase HpnB